MILELNIENERLNAIIFNKDSEIKQLHKMTLNTEPERLRAIIAKKDNIIDDLMSRLYNKEKEESRNATDGYELLRGQKKQIDTQAAQIDELKNVISLQKTEIRDRINMHVDNKATLRDNSLSALGELQHQDRHIQSLYDHIKTLEAHQ